MHQEFEERLVWNPALGAVLLWHFIDQYHARKDDTFPTLTKTLLVLPIVFHPVSVAKLKGMNFNSSLTKAVTECPLINAGLNKRFASLVPTSLKSVQLACASGLIERVPGYQAIHFRAAKPLPGALRLSGAPKDMAAAAKRLGSFFADSTLQQVHTQLRIVR